MERGIPVGIINAINKPVLEFIERTSAHSDVSEAEPRRGSSRSFSM